MPFSDKSMQRIKTITDMLRRQARAAEQKLRPWAIAAWRKFSPVALAVSRKTWLWGTRHKTALLAGVLLLYIIFRPSGPPQVSTANHALAPASPASTPNPPTIATTTSAIGTTKPAESESIAGIVLYEAKGDEANPQWGLPASLDNDQVRNLATKLKKLDKDSRQHFQRVELLSQEYQALSDYHVRQLLFDRIAGRGFKDKDVPILWRRFAKYNDLNGFANSLVDSFTAFASRAVLESRLESAINDVVDGSPTVGDTLFVATFQRFIDNGNNNLDKEMPVIGAFCGRIVAEFPELPLTYYDSDGTRHVHFSNPQPATPASPADVMVVQKLLAECTAKGHVYDNIIATNDKRKEAILSQLDSIVQINDQNVRAAWMACYQARVLGPYSYWQDQAGSSFSIRFISGQITETDKVELKSLAEKLTSETAEALRQRDLQLAFKAIAKGFPKLDRSLDDASAVWTKEPDGNPAK